MLCLIVYAYLASKLCLPLTRIPFENWEYFQYSSLKVPWSMCAMISMCCYDKCVLLWIMCAMNNVCYDDQYVLWSMCADMHLSVLCRSTAGAHSALCLHPRRPHLTDTSRLSQNTEWELCEFPFSLSFFFYLKYNLLIEPSTCGLTRWYERNII